MRDSTILRKTFLPKTLSIRRHLLRVLSQQNRSNLDLVEVPFAKSSRDLQGLTEDGASILKWQVLLNLLEKNSICFSLLFMFITYIIRKYLVCLFSSLSYSLI